MQCRAAIINFLDTAEATRLLVYLDGKELAAVRVCIV
jgi:hypothetical protein